MKSKITATVIAIFGACALCCLLPVASILGLSSAFSFLGAEKIELVTILLVATTILVSIYVFRKIRGCKSQSMCSTSCGCKVQCS